jgi:hypothetical protein
MRSIDTQLTLLIPSYCSIRAVDPADLEDLDFGRLDPDRTIGYPSKRKQEKFRFFLRLLPTGDQAERAGMSMENAIRSTC